MTLFLHWDEKSARWTYNRWRTQDWSPDYIRRPLEEVNQAYLFSECWCRPSGQSIQKKCNLPAELERKLGKCVAARCYQNPVESNEWDKQVNKNHKSIGFTCRQRLIIWPCSWTSQDRISNPYNMVFWCCDDPRLNAIFSLLVVQVVTLFQSRDGAPWTVIVCNWHIADRYVDWGIIFTCILIILLSENCPRNWVLLADRKSVV